MGIFKSFENPIGDGRHDTEKATMAPRLCECGCGMKTGLSKLTSTKAGVVKGQPNRFIHGHRIGAIPGGGGVRYPSKGKRRLHRIIAEAALGKPLPEGVEVHHADGSKSASSALVICENHAYHFLLHVRTRVLQAGGNPNTDKICGACKQVKAQTEFNNCKHSGDGLWWMCRTCDRGYQVALRAQKVIA